MNGNLRISNMIVSGKLPFKRKLTTDEVRKLIEKSKNLWAWVNEEISPTIQMSVDKEGFTSSHRQKRAVVSVWTTGAINIVGVTSTEESEKLYSLVISDFKRLCPGVLL